MFSLGFSTHFIFLSNKDIKILESDKFFFQIFLKFKSILFLTGACQYIVKLVIYIVVFLIFALN